MYHDQVANRKRFRDGAQAKPFQGTSKCPAFDEVYMFRGET
jgi:hypothetical protein